MSGTCSLTDAAAQSALRAAELSPAAIEELSAVLQLEPGFAVERIAHPRQRNATFVLPQAQPGPVVVKRYAHLRAVQTSGIEDAERRAIDHGVPVPPCIYRSRRLPIVVHDYVAGVHRQVGAPAEIGACARHFAASLRALRGLTPHWAPPRPTTLPYRSRQAVEASTDQALNAAVWASWQRLSTLARTTPTVSAHTDWRSDNFLLAPRGFAAILDWESIVQLPAAEAIGYAAGSFTHSWREDLGAPVQIEPITAFITAISHEEVGAWTWPHAGHAVFLTAATRLVEDRLRGIEHITLRQLLAELRW